MKALEGKLLQPLHKHVRSTFLVCVYCVYGNILGSHPVLLHSLENLLVLDLLSEIELMFAS